MSEKAFPMVSMKAYQAFGLRLKGLTLAQIAGKLDLTDGYVEHLFAKNGALYELWQDYRFRMKSEIMEEALDMMVGNLADITRAGIIEAKGSGMPANVARKIIYDIVLGRPAQGETFGDSLTEEAKVQIVKAFQAMGVKFDVHGEGSNQPGNNPAIVQSGGAAVGGPAKS